MFSLKETIRSAQVSLWFMFLTFPIMVIRVNAIEKTITWRWENMVFIGLGSFILSIFGRIFFERQKSRRERQIEEKIQRRNIIPICVAHPFTPLSFQRLDPRRQVRVVLRVSHQPSAQ